MSDDADPPIPRELTPRAEDLSYDLVAALAAVVSLRAEIPENAFTAQVLGTERAGHGVVIGERGLIVTIGYLVTEAERIWVVSQSGRVVAGDVIGYDYESGLGLVQALGALDTAPLALGSVNSLKVHDDVILAGYGGIRHALKARVAARREFAGYWEYVLDEAIFTAPPHPSWGGAALLGPDGKLCGIGSLYIDQVHPDFPGQDGNLSVPIDLLAPIMDELLRYGRTLKPARPWLGMFVSEADSRLVVAGMYQNAPAAQSDIRAGDTVLGVAGSPVAGLANLFRQVWAYGEAGCDVPLTVEREGTRLDVRIKSVDRRQFWRAPDLH